MGLISRNLWGSYLCFRLTLLQSMSHFFFIYRSPSLSLCTVFDSISSNVDEVLSINPSANVFVFGEFNVDHKDWLTYSGGTDRPGQLCYNFSQTTWLKWLTFLLGSQTVILIVQLFWIYLFLLTLVFYNAMALPPLWNFEQDAPFHLFFRLYQQNKSSESKVKFRQASNYWKRVLEAAKHRALAYAS